MCNPTLGNIASGLVGGGMLPAMQSIQGTKAAPIVDGLMFGGGVPAVSALQKTQAGPYINGAAMGTSVGASDPDYRQYFQPMFQNQTIK